MIGSVHLHLLHHTLDPLGIVLAAVALAAVVTAVGLTAAWLIRRHTRSQAASG